MFRGFSWQLLALILAAAVFAFAIVFRAERLTQSQPQGPAPSAVAASASPSPAPAATPAAEQISATSTQLPQASASAIYREGLVGAAQRLNPVFAHLNPVDQDLTSLIFRGLFTTDKYGSPVLDLAESLTISGDQLEYALALRQDVRWQDGIAFSADDVLYTMSLLSDPDYAAFSPSAEFWRTVETQKLGEHLLRFRLAQPLASFTRLLTIGILPEHALRGTKVSDLAQHPFNLSPIGTGPYQLGELRADSPVSSDSSVSPEPSGKISAVLLQRAPVNQGRADAQYSYQLSELLFNLYETAEEALQAYRRNEVDSLANIASRAALLELPAARLYTSLESTLQILIFNWEQPRFADRRMRRALALGLNQMEIVEARLAGEALSADSPLIPGMPVYQPHGFWSAHDPAQAAELLEALALSYSGTQSDAQEGGATADEDARLDEFTLLVADSASLTALAIDIAAQWQELGLSVIVDSVTANQMMERLRAGDFDAAIVSQRIGAEPDVYRFWHPAQSSEGQNYGSAAQIEIAELLDSARRAANGIARQQMYQSFQAIFAEKAIAIPLYYPLYSMITRDSIDGLQLGLLGSASDRFRNINSWRLANSPKALEG